MRDLSTDATPLLLLDAQLSDLYAQAQREEQAIFAQALYSTLKARDQKLLSRIQDDLKSAQALRSLESFMKKDRQKFRAQADIPRCLSMDREGFEQLRALATRDLERLRGDASEQLLDLELRDERLHQHDRKLDAVPERGAIEQLVEERRVCRASLASEEAQQEQQRALIVEVERQREAQRRRWVDTLEASARADFAREDLTRAIAHSERVRDTLSALRQRVLRDNLSRIEARITESLRQLLRKKSLVEKIEINPADYSFTLEGPDQTRIQPERLSAGERQLLAVSLLWGLAQASNTPLPTVIDTPLGRLDSDHRLHLVTRYFPNASHQVLLLSTDEEIDPRYYEALKPWIGHTYSLEYDDNTRSTTVRRGYFFNASGGGSE